MILIMRKPIHKFTKYSDLKEMPQESGKKFGDRPAYIFKTEKKDKFMEITHKEFRDEINNLGTKLIDMGLKDKRIAVISENRYEWAVDYLAVATGVGVIVPLDKALPDNEIENLIIRSEVEAIFYSKKYNEVMNKIKEQKNTNLKYFISMDLEKEEDGIKSQKELTEQGKVLIDNGNKEFLNAKIDNEKMGIMLFTSGTTAMSKAVMLSHKNICSNLADITSVIKVTEKDRFLSFLPLHFAIKTGKGCISMDTTADKTLSVASVPEAQRMEQDIKDWAQYSQWIAAAMSKRMSELGLTQKMLAEKMGCTQQYISKVLKGKKNMSLETICKIENALGIEIIKNLNEIK